MKKTDIINKANSVLGKKASYFGFKTEWCALLVNWLFGDDTPFSGAEQYSCTSQVNYWRREKRCFTDFSNVDIGDLIYYQWYDNTSGFDHVGIVVKRDDENLTVLEGNTRGSHWSTTIVSCRKIKINHPCLGCYAKPNYDTEGVVYDECKTSKPITKTYYSVNDVNTYYKQVELIQIMLNAVNNIRLDTDGYYGNKTQTAVLKFQAKYNLKIDGLAGKETITTLCKKYFNIS